MFYLLAKTNPVTGKQIIHCTEQNDGRGVVTFDSVETLIDYRRGDPERMTFNIQLSATEEVLAEIVAGSGDGMSFHFTSRTRYTVMHWPK